MSDKTQREEGTSDTHFHLDWSEKQGQMRKTKHLKSFLNGIFDDDTAHIAKKGTLKVMTMILCRNVHHQAPSRKKHIHHLSGP
jgi:hypothetical protein